MFQLLTPSIFLDYNGYGGNYYTPLYNYSYSFDYYYDHYHHEDCEMNVPDGLYVPSMCILYLFVGECQELGYDPHYLA